MNRRALLGAGMAGMAAIAGGARVEAGAQPARPAGRARMKIGTQHDHSDETLRVMAAFGVNNVCSRLPSRRLDEKWSVDALTKLRERVASFGVSLDMVPLPMSSSYVTRLEYPNIMLGKS